MSAAIGALRRRFSVEEPVAGADGSLAFQARFAAWGALDAARDPLAVRLRARPGLKPGWRLRLGARVFDVLAVQNDEAASGFMLVLCREMAT